MPGRKDKKSGDRKKRSQGGGGADSMAAMFGFPMPTDDDADLEAELMALEGKSPKKGGKSKSGKGGAFSMADVDSMLAGIGDVGEGGSGDDDDDMSDIDDEDLLGELQALQGGDDDEPAEAEPEPPSRPQPSQLAPKPAPRKPPTGGGGSSTSPQKGASGGGGNVQIVTDRLELYKQAVKQAEGAGEGAKARRYKRSIASLEQSLKSARAGRPVNVDDLPPIVSIKAAPSASQTSQPQTPPTTTTAAMATKPRPQPAPVAKPRPPPQQQPEAKTGNLIDLSGPEFDEFNLTDEELEAMAAAMVDDRKSQPLPSQTPPKIAPPTKTTPTSQPLTRQPLSTVASKPGPSPVPVLAPVSVPAPAPKPKPRPPAQSKPPPTLPSGMIDLDAEEFDEFNLSDEDLATMAAMLVDDRTKKPRLETEEKEIPMDTSKAPPIVPSRPAPQKPTSSISSTSSSSSIKPSTQSLPAKLIPPPASDGDKGVLKALLEERREQYLSASKAQKDAAKTKEYRVMAAQFGRVLKAFEQGQEVDLSQMPGPPPGYFSKYNVDVSKFKPTPRPPPSSQATAASPSASVGGGGATGGQSPTAAAASAEDEDAVNPDIPVPKTPLEALQQRLAKYKEGQKSAQEKGESSRVRRMGRIIKQYENAIKLTKAGKPCDYDELPTPPGFPPIPTAPMGARVPVRQVKPGVAAVAAPTQSLPVGGPAKPKQLPSRMVPSLSQEQQALVEQRRSELLTAARQAQAKNDKASAVHYMKLRKGLDTMLEAAKSGLPVNLEEIPPSPFADMTKTKPAAAVLSHLKPASEGDATTFDLIEKQLENQVKICDENAETYEKMGSTASSIQYQNMSQNCQRELLALKGIRLQGLAPPKFTMETRKFVIVHSHSEISSQVCEIEVFSASNLPRPSGYEEKDMNVYVEVEFPWPSEEPPKMSTNHVRDTCSPEFSDQIFKFDIDRKKLKSMQRVFKRNPVKCVVWQKRTLRKDIFMGQGMLSLEILDKKCEHRATVDLMDERGRKATGGKLTVEARLREPLTGRDQEEREEQWLVFHEAIAAKSSVSMPKPKVSPQKGAQGGSGVNFASLSPVKVESTTSLEALRVEYSLVQSAVKAGHKDTATIQRGKQIHTRMESIKQRLQSDPNFRQGFAKQVAKEMHNEQLLETQLAKQGKAKQAEVVILQKRRAAMEKELKAMQGRKM